MKAKKLTFLNDPGHGWLSVSNKDVKELGIADEISRYSYMSPTRSYLEEDCDAGIFLNAAKAAGWEVEIKNSYVESTPIRNYPDFCKYWIDNKFGVGSPVSFHNGTKGVVESKTTLRDEHGNAYRLFKSNPLKNLLPPTALNA